MAGVGNFRRIPTEELGALKGFNPYSYFRLDRASGICRMDAFTYSSQEAANLRTGKDSGGQSPVRRNKPTLKSEQRKDQGGLLSLVLELLGAVAISLVQRYFKSWRSTLIVKLHNPPEPLLSSTGLPKAAPKDGKSLPDQQSEISPEKVESEKPYQKGIVALFKNTASEWIQDKCPQLGAALAYFTVFSLAPLVLVLLAVFGLIFGGSDHAQEKLTEQLQYLIDPSGIKVIQDIAANASKPQAGFIATTIGVVLALFGASGVFGQLQDALNTIWGVKPKPGGGVMGFIRTRFLSFAMVGGVCFLLLAADSGNCLKRT